jgi:carbon monoxide dehydrogenase subunit G
MELVGEAAVAAPPADVWAALHNREALARLVPASRTFRQVGPGAFEGQLVLGVPPFAQRHDVRLTVSETPGGLDLTAAGTGRSEGLRLEVHCALAPGARAGTTAVAYRLTGQLGPLQRLVAGAAGQRLVAGFFAGLQAEIAGRGG